MVDKDAGSEVAATAGLVEEPYYHRTFKLKGSSQLVRGYLTYALGNDASPDRLICLVDYVDGLVPEEHRDEYAAFIEELESGRHSGRLVKAKSLVNRIRGDPSLAKRFPQARVAVHKLGPVPAFDTGRRQLIELHGRLLEARIVAYRNPRQGAHEDHSEAGQLALLDSLDHDDLHQCLQRYYEDVAVRLADIANYGNLARTLNWSKQCEHLIGQSMSSKLRVMAPGEKKPRDHDARTEWGWWKSDAALDFEGLLARRKEFFEKHRVQVFLAAYVKNTLLLFINELYAHLGDLSRRTKYRQGLIALNYRFQRYFGEGFLETMDSTIPEYRELQRLRNAYEKGSNEEIHRRSPLPVRIEWIEHLRVFIRHLYWLRLTRQDPHKARLFVSHQHDVAESVTLAKQIQNHIREHYPDDFVTLMVTGDEPPSQFKERIKSAIWQADVVTCVVVRDPRKTGGTGQADDAWVAREAEHAVLQGKRVIFIHQEGITVQDFVHRMIQRQIDFLLPEARLQPAQRIAGLRQECEDHPQLSFHIAGSNAESRALDPRVVKRLETEREAMLKSRHANLVSGYLMQFSREVCQVFQQLLPLARYPTRLSKAKLVDALLQRHGKSEPGPSPGKNLRRAIKNAWDASSQRSLEIGKETLRVLTCVDDTYSIELNRILRALSPSITDQEVKELEHQLLTEATDRRE